MPRKKKPDAPDGAEPQFFAPGPAPAGVQKEYADRRTYLTERSGWIERLASIAAGELQPVFDPSDGELLEWRQPTISEQLKAIEIAASRTLPTLSTVDGSFTVEHGVDALTTAVEAARQRLSGKQDLIDKMKQPIDITPNEKEADDA